MERTSAIAGLRTSAASGLAMGGTATIHPTAIVEPGAILGDGVDVGPFCHIGPQVRLADRVRLISHVVVDGHTTIGEATTVYPFATIGLAPQDLKYQGEPTRCVIGARTTIREHCTIHRGTVTGSGLTRVGDDCLIMAVAHVAHDCDLADRVILANNVMLGGHVSIGLFGFVGGGVAIHQFVRIGAHAMIGGMSGVEADVIPFGRVLGNRARLAGLNVVGMSRRGFDRADIGALRSVFRSLFLGDGVFADRLALVRGMVADGTASSAVKMMLDFIDQPSRRGLVRMAAKIDVDEEAD